MPVSAAIIGGAGLLGGIGSAVIGSNAAQSAAQTQAQSALQAQQFQQSEATQAEQFQQQEAQQGQAAEMQMFNTAEGYQQPYNTIGQGADQTLAGLYGISGSGAGTGTPTSQSLAAFTASPDYQFALDQGTQAMQRSAAAGGTLISGGQLKAGQEFGQGLATQQYGNYYNRLLSLAQLGQTAAAGQANTATTTGGQIGNTLTNAGAQVGNTLSNAGAQVGNTIQAQGQANASGIVGSANAISGGLSSATSSLSTAALLSRLGGGGGTSLSSYVNNPSYGGGNPLSGDAYGGSANNPLSGLSAADYG